MSIGVNSTEIGGFREVLKKKLGGELTSVIEAKVDIIPGQAVDANGTAVVANAIGIALNGASPNEGNPNVTIVKAFACVSADAIKENAEYGDEEISTLKTALPNIVFE